MKVGETLYVNGRDRAHRQGTGEASGRQRLGYFLKMTKLNKRFGMVQ